MLARRRRAARLRVAMLAVMVEDLETCEARYSLNDYDYGMALGKFREQS